MRVRSITPSSSMATILIIEDDPVFGELLVMHLEDRGHQPHLVSAMAKAREKFRHTAPEAILLDQQLPDGFGIDLLTEITALPSAPPVIMITGVSDNTLAIEAMRQGAYDFIRKPMDEIELDTTLGNALRTHRLSRQVSAITNSEDYRVDINQIVGESPAILGVCKTIGAVATRSASVLITGETGTGKEIVARAIHNHSGRQGLFLAVNCSALAEGVLESELFGHERGSFSGAVSRREGRFELAAGGTLFLDELGEMPASLQAKLLRVLQDGTFERVGGTQTLQSDARIIAATNRNLETMIGDGSFREDLYYRLNIIHIALPPLRDRMQDMSALTEHLLKKINNRQRTSVQHISEAAWRQMMGYGWPGNIRELENILTRAMVLARGDTLTPELLALPKKEAGNKVPHDEPGVANDARLISLGELEAEHITAILAHVHWHKGKACEILGISRPSLERKIDKYGIL